MNYSFKSTLVLSGLLILGTYVSWALINLFVVNIYFWHFVIIEIVISFSHAFYNKAKADYKITKKDINGGIV